MSVSVINIVVRKIYARVIVTLVDNDDGGNSARQMIDKLARPSSYFLQTKIMFANHKTLLTFAHISSIDPDVNEKFVDDDKAVFNLSI